MNGIVVALIMLLSMAPLAGSDNGALAGTKTKRVTKTSIVTQATQERIGAEFFQITDAQTPFTFQKVGKIRKIKKLRITVTLNDGDTGESDIDFNKLSLALDGIDTGLLLNGFRDDQERTRTISGKPINEAEIRAALKVDGELRAMIVDATAGDNSISGSSADQTTLVIKAKEKQ